MTTNPTNASTAIPAVANLPTLGDRPSAGAAAASRPRRARRRRTAALVAAVLVALVATSAGSAALAAAKFSDVPDSHPFAEDINWMANNGITKGYDDGTFRPTDGVTRQSAAAFLHRYNEQITVTSSLVTISGQTQATKYLDCPAGKRAIAGGGGASASNAALVESMPLNSSWKLRWVTTNGSPINDNNVLLFVTCAPKTD